MLLQAVFCCLLVTMVSADQKNEDSKVVDVLKATVVSQVEDVLGLPETKQKFHFNSLMTVSRGYYKGLRSLKVLNVKVNPITTKAPTTNPAASTKTAAATTKTAAETPLHVEFDLSFDDLSINYDSFVAKTLQFFKASGKWTASKIKTVFRIEVVYHPRGVFGKDCLTEVKQIALIDSSMDKHSLSCRMCFWMLIPAKAKNALRAQIKAVLEDQMYSVVAKIIMSPAFDNLYNRCLQPGR